MEKTKRLFFAVNLLPCVKKEIAQKILPLIPKGWKKTREENLHVTMHFLGETPAEAVKGLRSKAASLKGFEQFEAEINCAGHFGNSILWLGFGGGAGELSALNRKLQTAIGTRNTKFHAHITIARSKSGEKRQAQAAAERIGKEMKAMKIRVKSIELMESELENNGPRYSELFSVRFTQGNGQSFSAKAQGQNSNSVSVPRHRSSSLGHSQP